ncbi:hypothetical protein G7Z17_g456 [Cylindrodendrum hubeiense]|uniref:DUF7703 domain-containing protein n=1 Tax=Cylindrodendrum hubeiense TaxID=595255 RepID=A0A9P5HK65_9HYPO|nr:hypothetical protein G7Z17_g456 [Cylindrodendrum hubeiense]
MFISVELLCLIFITFKRREGLYFWSMCLASFAAIPYCIGCLIEHFDLTYHWVGMMIDGVGWVLLVSGQSMVLYSRLYLVLNNEKILRAVFWMIIANGVTWHTTMTVLVFGSKYSPEPSRASFTVIFNVLEKVQMTFFCLQEFIISGLYIWKTMDYLKTAFGSKRSFLWKLFVINVIIVAMDIGLLALEYKGLWEWQQGVKVVVYSIKLKLEFAVLGELIEFVRHRGGTHSGDRAHYNGSAFVEISGSRTQQGEKKARSMSRPEAIHLENMAPEKGVPATNLSTSMHRQQKQDEIVITTRIDMESSTIDRGDNESTDQLYGGGIEDVSRP